MSIHVRKTGSTASWLWITALIILVISAYATDLYGLQPWKRLIAQFVRRRIALREGRVGGRVYERPADLTTGAACQDDPPPAAPILGHSSDGRSDSGAEQTQ